MSIEAMKQAVATIDKIIEGCNNVQEEKDIHGDAKTLAKLIKKDCFPTLEALRQAIKQADRHISLVCPNCHWSLNRQEDDIYDIWVEQENKGEEHMSNKDTIIEALTMQLKLEREGNLALAKREWVGLTDKEVDEWTPEIHNVIRAIEAKLKEKNT